MGKGRIHLLRRARDEDGGETRQPPPGATPNRQAMTRPVELAGRWLERWSNPGPRGMTVGDRKASYRTRLTAGFPLLPPGVDRAWLLSPRHTIRFLQSTVLFAE